MVTPTAVSTIDLFKATLKEVVTNRHDVSDFIAQHCQSNSLTYKNNPAEQLTFAPHLWTVEDQDGTLYAITYDANVKAFNVAEKSEADIQKMYQKLALQTVDAKPSPTAPLSVAIRTAKPALMDLTQKLISTKPAARNQLITNFNSEHADTLGFKIKYLTRKQPNTNARLYKIVDTEPEQVIYVNTTNDLSEHLSYATGINGEFGYNLAIQPFQMKQFAHVDDALDFIHKSASQMNDKLRNRFVNSALPIINAQFSTHYQATDIANNYLNTQDGNTYTFDPVNKSIALSAASAKQIAAAKAKQALDDQLDAYDVTIKQQLQELANNNLNINDLQPFIQTINDTLKANHKYGKDAYSIAIQDDSVIITNTISSKGFSATIPASQRNDLPAAAAPANKQITAVQVENARHLLIELATNVSTNPSIRSRTVNTFNHNTNLGFEVEYIAGGKTKASKTARLFRVIGTQPEQVIYVNPLADVNPMLTLKLGIKDEFNYQKLLQNFQLDTLDDNDTGLTSVFNYIAQNMSQNKSITLKNC